MSRTDTPLRRWWPLVTSCSLVLSCASVVGLDDLAYDLGDGDGGAGPAGPGSTSTGEPATTSSASTSTTDASSSSAVSSSASSGSGGDGGGGSGGEGGSPPTGFVVTGDREGYSDFIRSFGEAKGFDAAIWHFDEPDGASVAQDSGEGFFDGDYKAKGGTLTYQVPGIFADDHAVTFAGGARVNVEDDGDPYNMFQLRATPFPFAFMFFAKLDAVPAEPIVIASCYEEGTNEGWRLLLSDEIVFEQHGMNGLGTRIQDLIKFESEFPIDGAWHFVILTRQDDDGVVRGYLDGAIDVEGETTIEEYPQYGGELSLGAEANEADAAEVTLDEVAFFDAEIDNGDVVRLIACLQGESCDPPDD